MADDLVYAPEALPKEDLPYAPTEPLTGIPPNGVLAIPAIRSAIDNKLPVEQQYDVLAERVAREGVTPMLQEFAKTEHDKKLQRMSEDYEKYKLTNPSAAASIVADAQRAQRIALEGKYDEATIPHSVLEGFKNNPNLQNGAYERGLSANEIAVYTRLNQAIADNEMEVQKSPVLSFLKTLGVSMLGWTFASMNQNMTEGMEAAIPEGDFSLLNSKDFSVQLFSAISKAATPRQAVEMFERFKKGASTTAITELEQLQHIASGYAAENKWVDLTLQSAFMPVGFGTAKAIMFGLAREVLPSTVVKAVAKANPEVGGQVVKAAMEGDRVASSVLSKDDAVTLAFSNSGLRNNVDDILQGLPKATQAAIVKESEDYIQSMKGVTPSTLDESQKLREAERIVALHKSTDKSIVNMEVKEVTDTGVVTEVLRNNGYTGRNFKSIEEAAEYAATHGLPQSAIDFVKVEGRLPALPTALVDPVVITDKASIESLLKEVKPSYNKAAKAVDDDAARTLRSSYERVAAALKDDSYLAGTVDDDLDILIATAEGNREAKNLAKGKHTVAFKADEPTYLIKETRFEPFLLDNVGTHTAEDIAAISKWNWLDPKQKITKYTYEGALAMQFATGREKVALVKFFESATKGLSAKEQKRVFDVLSEIDAMSNAGDSLKNLRIDYHYLTAKGLNDKQIKLYSRVRDIRDVLWSKHNDMMVKELHRTGYTMQLSFTDEALGQVSSAVHIYADAGTLKSMVSQGKIAKVYDLSTKSYVSMNAAAIDDLFAKGKQVAKLKAPQGGVKHVIVGGQHHIAPLRQALPYRPHEFSRIYSEDYFLTYKTTEVVDGVSNTVVKTFRTAANAKEALAFATAVNKSLSHLRAAQRGEITFDAAKTLASKEMVAFGRSGDDIVEAVKNGEMPLDAEVAYHFDRVKEDALTSLMDEHIANGRMFESQRNAKLLSVYADRNNILSPMESLGVEMAVVTKKANMSDWRKATIGKWLNTFVADGSRTGDDIADFMNSPIKYSVGTQEYSLAHSEKEYIRSMINGRSVAEKEMAAKARYYIEHLEQKQGIVGAVAEKVFTGMQLRKADPLQFLRTINFHISLGLFNPAQLMVQSMGMMNAMFIHPVHGVKAAYTAIPLRLALMSDNPAVWKKLAHVGKANASEEEFVKLVQAVRSSGVLSTVKNTAFHNNASGFDNIFKEYGGGAFGKVSTTFFDRGEEMSRLVSWDVARREWMAANKGVDWTTPEAINAITGRMDDYTMGMTAANIANYQRGIASIPAQFLQYNIKLATEIGRAAMGNGRALTQAQAGWIVLGNLIMFGTAGTGIRGLADEMFGEGDSLSEDQKLALTQGAIAALLNEISDGEAKLATGSRLGSFNWYGETITKLVNGTMDIPDFMFGVSKSNMVKAIDAFSEVAAIWHPMEGMDSETTMEAMKLLATIPSGFSNANKMYTLLNNEGRLYSKRGDLLTTVSEKEAYAQLLGIQPSETPDTYYQLELMSADSKDFKDRVSTYKHLQMRYLQNLSEGDEKAAKAYWGAMTLMQTEDPDKASKLLHESRIRGGLPLSDDVKRKLEQRALDKPVLSN